MSKSLGNYIAIEDPPEQMYGKLMSLSDETMWTYWRLCTQLPEAEVERLQRAVAAGEEHPKKVKQRLARTIVGDFWGAEAAAAAEREFERVFAAGELPAEMPEVRVVSAEPVWIVRAVRECGFAASNGEARRLVGQGAVSIDGERVTDVDAVVPNDGRARVLRVGRRRFARLVVAAP